MRRPQQRRRPRRGSGQSFGAEGGRRVSPSDQGAYSANKGSEKAPAASCCSLSGAETPQEMARRRSPGRFSPSRCFLDAYSSEPEAAGGEGGLGQRGCYKAHPYREDGGLLLPVPPRHKNKACYSAQVPHHKKHGAASAAAHPLPVSAWQHQHMAPAGEGFTTPCTTTSCTTLYGGDFAGQPEHLGRLPAPAAKHTRVEELREDQWASPVSRPIEYDFVTDASKSPSVCPSSFSFTNVDAKSAPSRRDPRLTRRDWQEPCESSPSLADLMQTLAHQYEEDEPPPPPPPAVAYGGHERGNGAGGGRRQHHHHHHHEHHHRSRKGGDVPISIQDLADKRLLDLMPERDKKIAAMMLARHQEEEEMKDRQLQATDAWEKMKWKEKKHKSKMDKDRQQYQMGETLYQWQRDQDQRRNRLRLEEQQLLAARERDIMLRDKKWKKMAKEQECRRREKMENAKLQSDYRKRCQEKQLWDKKLNDRGSRDHSSHMYKEKMLQALEKKLIKEMERKRRKVDMNDYKRSRHTHLKEQVDDRLKADELYKRLCIEQKLQRSQEILEQLLDERNRELKERSFKDEEQGLVTRAKAKETEEEKRRRKEMLLQIAEMKIQQARDIMTKNMQDRTQRMQEINCMKDRNHHCRKPKLDEEEKCHLREMQEALRRKDQKNNQLLRHKDAALEESRRIARASYDLREKARDLMNHNSYDRMVLDCHRNGSLLRGL